MKQAESANLKIDLEKKHDQDFSEQNSERDSKLLTDMRYKITQPPPTSELWWGRQRPRISPIANIIFRCTLEMLTEDMWDKRLWAGLVGFLYNVSLKRYVAEVDDRWCSAVAVKFTDALMFKLVADDIGNKSMSFTLKTTLGGKQFYMSREYLGGAVRLYEDKDSKQSVTLQDWVQDTRFTIVSMVDKCKISTSLYSSELYVCKKYEENNYEFEYHLIDVMHGNVVNDKASSKSKNFSTFLSSDISPSLKALNSHSYEDTEELKSKNEELMNENQRLRNELEKLRQQLSVPTQVPISLSILLPVSQVIPQTMMPGPKPMASASQSELQDQLIQACKQGDDKTVTALLKQGAKPDMPNTKGEEPLGAAVWGMCPDVVDALLKQKGGVTPLIWDDCEKHNQKHYKEVFIVSKFDPKTVAEWNNFLDKMTSNLFIRAFHLKKADEKWHDKDTSSWENLKTFAWRSEYSGRRSVRIDELTQETEAGYVNYRTQIKEKIVNVTYCPAMMY